MLSYKKVGVMQCNNDAYIDMDCELAAAVKDPLNFASCSNQEHQKKQADRKKIKYPIEEMKVFTSNSNVGTKFKDAKYTMLIGR